MSTTAPLLQSLAAALADGSVKVVDLTQPLHEKTPVLKLPRAVRQHARPHARTRSAATTTAARRGRGAGSRSASTSARTSTRRSTGSRARTARTSSASRRAARRARGDDRQVGRGRGGPRLPADRRRRPRVRGRARPAARRAAGCCCARAGTRAPTTRTEFLNAGDGDAADARRRRGVRAVARAGDADRRHRRRDGRHRRRAARPRFDPPFPVHSFFLGAGKYGLTQLANLALLPPTGAVLVVAPLKLVGGTGSPTRVLALVGAG